MTSPDDRLESIANRMRAIREQRAVLDEAYAALTAEARDAVGDARGVIKANGKAVLSVVYRKVFNEAQAQSVLPPDVLLQCSETKVNASKAKAVLAPALYELCQVESTTPVITPKQASS